MRSAKVPEGWQFWTSEPDSDRAWSLVLDYKRMREGARVGVFVRARVVPVRGVHWILLKEEETGTA